jgi:hypothetical protein
VLSVVSLLLTSDGLSALCGFQDVSVRGVGARGGVARLFRGRSLGFWPRAELSSMGACVGVVMREDLFALHCAGDNSAYTRSRKRQ